MIFQQSNGHTPVSQDFVWAGEYYDGSSLTEFDFKTGKANSFYSVEKQKLIRFGLLGQGMRLYYEIYSGMFNINGQLVSISYLDKNGKEYFLTGQNHMYNDIITYKDAYSDAKLGSKAGNFNYSTITQYNFGYKTSLNIEEIDFNFQAIFSLPYNKPAFIQFKITASEDLDGSLLIKRGGKVIDTIEAPLQNGYAGVLNWVFK